MNRTRNVGGSKTGNRANGPSFANRLYSTGGAALLGVIVATVFFSIFSPVFLTEVNLANIGRQMAVIAIVSAGMTVVIISGGIDLSVGSTVALAGTLAAAVMAQSDLGPFWGTMVGLITGLGVGLLNGLMIAFLKIPPIIATLAMLSIARGAALQFTDGRSISGLLQSYGTLGRGEVGPVPIAVVAMVVVYLIGHFVLRHTSIGHHVYGIGGNEEAARLAGINIKRYKLGVYSVAGVVAGFAGLILVSRLGSGQPTAGSGLELNAIAAAVLGGTRITGGQGTLVGTLFGALLITVLGNGLDLMNVGSFIQMILVGVILAMSVALSEFTQK